MSWYDLYILTSLEGTVCFDTVQCKNVWCYMCHAAFDYCLSLSCCVHIIRSGVNQTVNPWYYPLNWGIMPRWVISGKSMEWPIMKSIKASLRIFFLNLIKKSIKSRLDCSSHTCCGWTWYLSTSPTPLSISLFLSIHIFLLAPIVALFSPVFPFLVIYCIIFLALLHLVSPHH